MSKIAEKNDWKTLDMPKEHDSFIYVREFTSQEMEALRRGHVPEEMEDKWFWYMEGDTLFAHRSWSGVCIYRIDFKPDHRHVVTVNRNTEQYDWNSLDEDADQLNTLLEWWTQENYDYKGEWLAETAEALKKAGER